MTTLLTAKTKAGQNLINKASSNIGFNLWDVYSSFSYAKEQAYKHCLQKYFDTERCLNFRIISANTFQFSVAWEGLYTNPATNEKQEALFVETASNSYIVLL